MNADVPRYQQAPPMRPQPKKKWPIVVAIIAVIVALARVLGFVVLPNVLSPDKHAIAKLSRSLEQVLRIQQAVHWIICHLHLYQTRIR